jgi:hypothetical protein
MWKFIKIMKVEIFVAFLIISMFIGGFGGMIIATETQEIIMSKTDKVYLDNIGDRTISIQKIVTGQALLKERPFYCAEDTCAYIRYNDIVIKDLKKGESPYYVETYRNLEESSYYHLIKFKRVSGIFNFPSELRKKEFHIIDGKKEGFIGVETF